MRRRAFLATAATTGATAAAGCLGRPSPREVEDPWVRREVMTDLESGDERTVGIGAVDNPQKAVRGRMTLRGGQFYAVRISGENPMLFGLRATERLKIPLDFLTMTPGALARYRDGREPEVFSSGTSTTTHEVRFGFRLPAGEYVHVIDNTHMSDAPARDRLTLDVLWSFRET